MSAEPGTPSGYMGAFQDFVQAKAPEENSASAHRPAGCVMEPVAGTSEMESSSQDTVVSDYNKPSSSAADTRTAKRCKVESDDSDDDTESEVANDKSSSPDSESSEPPAVPKRPRTQRSAKQKHVSKISGSRGGGRGRGRGRGRG